MSFFKKGIVGLLCGLIVGAVVLGVGGRIVMSGIALMGHLTPAWSLGGAVGVIAFGAIVGAVSGLAYVAARKYLPGSRLAKGLLAGLLLFGVMALIRPPSARTAMAGFANLEVPILLMFGALCLVYGVALVISVDTLSERASSIKKRKLRTNDSNVIFPLISSLDSYSHDEAIMPTEILNQLALFGDNPTTELDALQFDRYVTPLVEIITNEETDTPFVIGIFGKWGTGKTTLLKLIEKQLKAENYPTVWFNPWLYQTEDSLIVPLLQNIHDVLMESEEETFIEEAARILTVAAKVSGAVLLKAVTRGEVTLDDVQKRIKEYNENHGLAISAIREMREDLQDIVNTITNEGKNGRLMLFIDDLDRCVPTKIIGLLEAIKLFMDLKHTIILLAIDRDIVQQGIQVFYKDFDLQESLGSTAADYMDKMIQLPLYLNPLGPQQVGEYMKKLPLGAQLNKHKEVFQRCLQPNPRKIKRVLNIYTLTQAIVDATPDLKDSIDKSLLVKLIIVQQQWYELYRTILKYRELPGVLESVYKGDLRFDRPGEWKDIKKALGDRYTEVRKKSQEFYQPASLLKNLFTYGVSFQGVELDEYLYMLG